MKKFTNLPPEGLHILFSALVGIFLLIVLFGCATPLSTSLDSCKGKIEPDKSVCTSEVTRIQNYYVDRREMFKRMGR